MFAQRAFAEKSIAGVKEDLVYDDKAKERAPVKVIATLCFVLGGLSLGACGTNGAVNSAPAIPHSNEKTKTISGAQAWNHVGQLETVEFHVAYAFTDNAGTEFLDQKVHYTQGFVVTIFASDLGRFTSDPVSSFDGQTIEATGTISTYGSYVEILDPVRLRLAR